MRPQLIVVPVAVLMMLLALVAGVFRLLALQGMVAQPPLATVFPFHGEIMVFGFLAVLITTERYLGSLAFKLNPIVHGMPFLVALGAVLKVVGELAGVDLMNTVGSILLAVGIAIYIYLLLAVSRQSAQPLPFRFMVLAALFLLMGNLFSLRGSPVGNINFTLFLLGFPILTILGERVELSRFLAPAVYRRGEWGLWAALMAFLLLLVQDGRLLVALWAVLMALATLPLMGSELALVRVGQTSPQKLHRYLGQHLLLAYSWFFLGLVLVIVWAAVRGGSALYDASVHSLAVGFVGTMILAHAPVIAPAILPRTIAQEKLNLLPLELLTVGNLLRVGGYVLKGAGLPLGGVVGVSGLFILAALLAFAWVMTRSLRPA